MDTTKTGSGQTAGLLDIRNIIGALLGIYGVTLLVVGLTGTSQADLAKADGVNVNLWTGIGLVVASAVFLIWARLRPILVPLEREIEDAGESVQTGQTGARTSG